MNTQQSNQFNEMTTVQCEGDFTYVRLPLSKVVQLLRPIMREQPDVIHWSQYQEYADQYYFRSINIYMQYLSSHRLYTTYGGENDSFLANLPKRNAMCLQCYSRIILRP